MDLSVILNLHDEVDYVSKTLESLEQAMGYAIKKGLLIELIVVIDNEKDNIGTIVERFNFSVPMRIIRVKNCSLGPSRNDGISLASGEFVAVADGDDLVSSNYFYDSYIFLKKIEENNDKVIVFPEYVMHFDRFCFITKFVNSDQFSAEDFAYFNPYPSRFMARTSIFQSRKFSNLHKNSGFAFEDWDYNCYLFSKDFNFAVVPDVILFYRRRVGSIMAQKDYCKLIPNNELFNPKVFLSHSCENYQVRENRKRLKKNNVIFLTKRLQFLVREQMVIEPKLRGLLSERIVLNDYQLPLIHWGFLLAECFRLTSSELFENVWVLDKWDVNKLLSRELLTNKQSNVLIVLYSELNSEVLEKLSEIMHRHNDLYILNFGHLTSRVMGTVKNRVLIRFLLSIAGINATCYISQSILKRMDRGELYAIGKYYIVSSEKMVVRKSCEAIREHSVVTKTRNFQMLHPSPLTVNDHVFRKKITTFLAQFPLVYTLVRKIYFSFNKIT